MITFDNIKAFVKEAMNKNCETWACIYDLSSLAIVEYNGAHIEFGCCESSKVIEVVFKGSGYKVPVTQKEILEWKLLLEDLKVYSEQYLENTFFNFFKSDNKPVDINDLDDAEEE